MGSYLTMGLILRAEERGERKGKAEVEGEEGLYRWEEEEGRRVWHLREDLLERELLRYLRWQWDMWEMRDWKVQPIVEALASCSSWGEVYALGEKGSFDSFYAVREAGGFSSGPRTEARLRAEILVFASSGKIAVEETSFVGYIEQLLWSHRQAYPLIEATEVWLG